MKQVYVLLALVFFSSVNLNAQQGKYLQVSSSSCGYFNWGSDWWQPGTNHEHRYAESFVYLNFTENLHHPTYLNAALVYSQTSGHVTIDIYISIQQQINIDFQNDPHWHHHWWNGNSVNLGYYVGRVVADGTGTLASFNIEDWISTNPSKTYYLLFDQNDDYHDAALNMAWLGPPARVYSTDINLNLSAIPENMDISNYPNPFNSSTRLHYSLSKSESVSIKIFNGLGQLLTTLKENEFQQPGMYNVTWNGLDGSGNPVSSGLYIIRLETSGQILHKKVVLSR